MTPLRLVILDYAFSHSSHSTATTIKKCLPTAVAIKKIEVIKVSSAHSHILHTLP